MPIQGRNAGRFTLDDTGKWVFKSGIHPMSHGPF